MRPIIMMTAALALCVSTARGEDSPVEIELQAGDKVVKPGEDVSFDLVFHIRPDFHIYPLANELPSEVADLVVPTSVRIAGNDPAISHVRLIWADEAHHVDVDLGGEAPVRVPVHSGEVRARVVARLSPAVTPGARSVDLEIAYQACSDTICKPPTRTVVPLVFSVEGAPLTQPAPSQPFEVNIFGVDIRIDPDSASGLFLWLVMAALAGFVLNLMPCVLPMISIKIEMMKSYAGSPGRAFWLGFMMFLGILSFWTALGVLVAFVSGFGGISALFQTPAFTITAGLFMGVMGVLMLREYALTLPGFLNNFNPLAKTASGAYFFGVMQVVFATACAAPFMGSAVAWAMGQGRPVLALATFVAAGVGMGLPLWFLTIVPHVRRIIPGGQWGVAIKKAMGWLMIGAACYFVGAGHNGLLAQYPFIAKVQHIWGALICLGVAAGMLLYYSVTLQGNRLARGLLGVLSLALLAGCLSTGYRITETERQAGSKDTVWREFDRAELERARASGKVVIVDFTADWCINCKVLEQTVLKTDEIEKFARSEDVECFVADVTVAAGPGYEFMRTLGRGDPPLLVVYGPALGDYPIVSNAYSIADLKGYVRRAKGE